MKARKHILIKIPESTMQICKGRELTILVDLSDTKVTQRCHIANEASLQLLEDASSLEEMTELFKDGREIVECFNIGWLNKWIRRSRLYE